MHSAGKTCVIIFPCHCKFILSLLYNTDPSIRSSFTQTLHYQLRITSIMEGMTNKIRMSVVWIKWLCVLNDSYQVSSEYLNDTDMISLQEDSSRWLFDLSTYVWLIGLLADRLAGRSANQERFYDTHYRSKSTCRP